MRPRDPDVKAGLEPGTKSLSRSEVLATLAFAEAEGRAVVREWPGSQLLLGTAASERALRAAIAAPLGSIDFATHAVDDLDLPLRSFLLLAPGDGDDGFLRAKEIHRMQIRAALVVLSACESAKGRLRTGEGDLSLVRAFLQAGAGAVLGSVFPADDQVRVLRDSSVSSTRGLPRVCPLKKRVWANFTLSGLPGVRFEPVSRRISYGWPLLLAAGGAAVVI